MYSIYLDKFLKTRKIREAEEAARRSRITKVMPSSFSLLLLLLLLIIIKYCNVIMETQQHTLFTRDQNFRINLFMKIRKQINLNMDSISLIMYYVCLQAVIRIRFPDNHTLEATFHPSETIQSLIDLLTKVIAQPEQPFYICKHYGVQNLYWLLQHNSNSLNSSISIIQRSMMNLNIS